LPQPCCIRLQPARTAWTKMNWVATTVLHQTSAGEDCLDENELGYHSRAASNFSRRGLPGRKWTGLPQPCSIRLQPARTAWTKIHWVTTAVLRQTSAGEDYQDEMNRVTTAALRWIALARTVGPKMIPIATAVLRQAWAGEDSLAEEEAPSHSRIAS
jgi:hypothetical protein